MLSLRSLTLTAAASLALGAVLAGCSGTTSTQPPAQPLAQQPAAQSSAVKPDTKANALYVSDNVGKSVFRFVLNADGTLQTPAGSSLVLPYNPLGIAINGTSLFVTNQVNNSIEVYTAGSTGSASPKRSIQLNFEPTSVAVDSHGNTFVGGSTTGFVAVFAPRAHGRATPIQVISLPDGHKLINGVAVDSAGDMYVSDTNEVSEFTTPTTKPTLFRAIVGTGQQSGPAGMALDSSGELYVANTADNNVLAYSPTANGTSPPDRTILANGSVAMRFPLGDAVKGTNLYVTAGTTISPPPAVFVFNSQLGGQTPIQIVTGSYLALPAGAALGP